MFFILFICVFIQYILCGGSVHASVDLSPIANALSVLNQKISVIPPDVKQDLQESIKAVVNSANSLVNQFDSSLTKDISGTLSDADRNVQKGLDLGNQAIDTFHQDFHNSVQDMNNLINKTAMQMEAWGQKNFQKMIKVMLDLAAEMRHYEMSMILEFNKMACTIDSDFDRLESLFISIFDAVLDGNQDCREKLGLVGKVIPYDSWILHYRFKKCVLISDLDEMSNLDDIVTKYEELNLMIEGFLCKTNSSEGLKHYFTKEKMDVLHHLKFLDRFATPSRDYVTINETRHSTSKMVKEYSNSVTNVLDVLNVVNSEAAGTALNNVVSTVPKGIYITTFALMLFILPLAFLVAIISTLCLGCYTFYRKFVKKNRQNSLNKEGGGINEEDMKTYLLKKMLIKRLNEKKNQQQQQQKEQEE